MEKEYLNRKTNSSTKHGSGLLGKDDKLLWQSGQAVVVLDENGEHLKFKKDSSLFGYLTWLIENRKV